MLTCTFPNCSREAYPGIEGRCRMHSADVQAKRKNIIDMQKAGTFDAFQASFTNAENANILKELCTLLECKKEEILDIVGVLINFEDNEPLED